MIFGIVSLIHVVFNYIWNCTFLYVNSFEIRSEHVSFCLCTLCFKNVTPRCIVHFFIWCSRNRGVHKTCVVESLIQLYNVYMNTVLFL